MANVPNRRRVVRSVFLVVALSCVPPCARGAGPNRSLDEVFGPRVHAFYRQAFQIALDDADHKLLQVACQDLFADFVDRDGRSLAADLAATGETAVAYLRDIHFLDGRWTQACSASEIYAWTQPGSHSIQICLDRFARLARVNPSAAGNILIHEELHALGLGENPPASLEISARVGKRCGR